MPFQIRRARGSNTGNIAGGDHQHRDNATIRNNNKLVGSGVSSTTCDESTMSTSALTF